MNRKLIAYSSCRSCRRFNSCAWTETSSAETDSSQIRTSGRRVSARAIAILWRWPPENSCGYLANESAARPTLSSSSRRSEEHTSELQSPCNLVCRLLLEKKKKKKKNQYFIKKKKKKK